MLLNKLLRAENKRNIEVLREDGIYGDHDVHGNKELDEIQRKEWPDDLRAALRILHSKVARRSIASVPFIAEIISNDVAFTGSCCPIVFSRIIAKAGTSTVWTVRFDGCVHVDIFI